MDASNALPNIHNGLFSGAAFALATLVAVYIYLRRLKHAAALAKPEPHLANKLNPLFERTAKRPRPPPGKAPKHAFKAFSS